MLGVMLQRGGIYPMLDARRALDLFASYYPRAEDPDELLELLALRSVARTPWRHLSGGEQQRLSLALALIGRPRVLFLDEPTAGVDPEGRQTVRTVIEQARDRGVCVLLSTHELPEAERLANRVVIIHHGRLVAQGDVTELARAAGTDEVTFGAPAGLDVASLSAALGAPVHQQSPGRYVVESRASPKLTARLASWLAERDATLVDLRTARTLEETYLALVGDAAPNDAPPNDAPPNDAAPNDAPPNDAPRDKAADPRQRAPR
jgi:ABC-2 type transport system ATP-binding protein